MFDEKAINLDGFNLRSNCKLGYNAMWIFAINVLGSRRTSLRVEVADPDSNLWTNAIKFVTAKITFLKE